MQDSNEILRVENLSLSFNINLILADSLRESFVQIARDPINFLFRNKESLKVFSEINLSLNKGDRLGILGVNGCGKTSFCRCVSSMLTPDTGRVLLNGNEVLSIFSTATGVDPELTGRENAHLLSVLIFPDLSKKERARLLEDACSFSELGDFLDVPFKYYSKGMQARIFLSLVSSKSSDLLILDEVFDGADIFFREKVSKRIMDMIYGSGAVIFVTHELDNLEKVCNRAIIMHHGGIHFDGAVEEAKVIYKGLVDQ